jgi:hypothetical protein
LGKVLQDKPIDGIRSGDWGALFAGGDHFINNLAGPFNTYIQNLVAHYIPTCDLAGLKNAEKDMTTEHESLFQCAVVPGFETELARGEISDLAALIAKTIVPFTAGTMRKVLILEAEISLANLLVCLRKSLSKRYITTAVTLSDLQNVAKFNNLTIPSNPAFQNDYRTWVEISQPVLSTANLPGAYHQILPTGADVVVDVQLNDSTAGVKITADRSSFSSEAVIAVSLSPVDPTNSSAPQQYANSSLAIFGDVVSVLPATSPIGDNGYLFNNLTNSSVAQALNESSVFDHGYNVLFDTFGIVLSFVKPAPVPLASLVIVDLVSGTVLPSTGKKTPGAVVAHGIKGHGSAWGGGGAYAVGYNTSPNSITSRRHIAEGKRSSLRQLKQL